MKLENSRVRCLMALSRRGFLGLALASALKPKPVYAASLSCGAPPPAKPHRIKGGESFPPLPLPVTPLRRTERKRPPAPPLLIAKLNYGEKKRDTDEKGKQYEYWDWKTDPADAEGLLGFACPKLHIRYRSQVVGPNVDRLDPREHPIVYITGHQFFDVPDHVARFIQGFVYAGGTVVGDACCGSPPFSEGFMAFMKRAFPNRRFKPLPPDHGVYKAFFPVEQVVYQEGAKEVAKAPPEIHGMELGCRAAVVMSKNDMSCGWDKHIHDTGARLAPADAMRLGTNFLSYTLANQELGRFLASTKFYHEQGAAASMDDFVFGQLVHNGDWDPDPSAAANLLKAVQANSSIDVRFVRKDIDAATPDLFEAPFLYMTGHHDFTLTDAEVANLRMYLSNGGFLLADACCGRRAFDEALRRELARVFPGRELEPIPRDDPFYSCLYRIGRVRHTLSEGTHEPPLLGMRVQGVYAVVYSPVDLGNGWEGVDHPFVNSVAREDALKIGMNAVMYALTH